MNNCFAPIGPACHPACLDMFTDAGSLLHFLLGYLVGNLPGQQVVTIAVMYTGYQLSQHATGESFPRIGGELFEFALGMLTRQFTE